MAENEIEWSLQDYILIPSFLVSQVFMSFDVSRLALLSAIAPVYIWLNVLKVLPHVFSQCLLLLSSSGRARLVNSADRYREQEQKQAAAQWKGTRMFQHNELLRGEQDATFETAKWDPRVKRFLVCGAWVNVVHEKPKNGSKRSGKQILLLHGNPSWSFMWRNVIPRLVSQGHEVFAIDWLGHGASDKPASGRLISFELHMRTLVGFFEYYKLQNCYIAAHDWGGCVALCTIPELRKDACAGLFLLNTFFPPRPSDISLHYYLLYLIWFCCTGVLDGYTPEPMVMRYMAPTSTSGTVAGYEAPYKAGPMTKASVNRFAHIVPGIPDFILSRRGTYIWRTIEGLCGAEHFTNLNAQAWLGARNVSVRRFWASREKINERPAVAIAFGKDDPLLAGFKDVLAETIDPTILTAPQHGVWIPKAGHYPTEEKPMEVADLISKFAKTRSLA